MSNKPAATLRTAHGGTSKVSIEPKTYSGEAPIAGTTLDCSRCARVHAFPKPSAGPTRCECGWWYRNENGLIMEEFRPRLGV